MQTKKLSIASVALPMGLAGIFVAAFIFALNVARAEYGSSAEKRFAMSVNQSAPTPTPSATAYASVSPSPSTSASPSSVLSASPSPSAVQSSTPSQAGPDLIVDAKSLYYYVNGFGEELIYFEVRNSNPSQGVSPSSVGVSILVNGRTVSLKPIGGLFSSGYATYNIFLPQLNLYRGSTNQLSFAVDPDNSVKEQNESNNSFILNYFAEADSKTFTRGDANGDGVVDVSDPSAINNYFNGGRLSCLDAADANDDGIVDVKDSEYILNYLFSGGPAPKQPTSAVPGLKKLDPTPDALSCNTYPSSISAPASSASPKVSPSSSPSPVSSISPSPSPKQTVTERFYADPDKDEYGTPNNYITVEQNSALPAGYMRWITGRDNDNCPTVYNPDQKDTDKDGKGDICDTNVTPTPTASVSPTPTSSVSPSPSPSSSVMPFPTPTPITSVVPPVTVAAKVFLRGDANQDNRVDQSDSILIRDYLNIGGRLSCLDAADVNDDGFVTMNDVNYLQSWLFLGTATEPPKPGAFTKGADPTPDDMGCGEKEGSPTGTGGTYTDNLMFLRGDANSDGVIDISDATRIANHIQGSGRVRCSDAADANDDGFVNNQDYEYIVNYLFHGGPAPSSPTPSRGYGGDLTPDSIGCMDNSPAILSNLSVTGITKTSAVVQWDTEKDSDSHVLYGTTLVNGAISGGAETGSADPLLRNHTVVLQDLRSGTKYNVQAISSHDRGITQGVSGIESFTTLGTRPAPVSSPIPQTSPVPSGSPKPSVSPKPAVSPSPSGVSIGDLVKEKGKPAVYVVVGDTIRPFLNAKVFFESGYTSFDNVKEFPTLGGYVQGIVITEPTMVIAPPGLPEITPSEPVIISPKPASSPALTPTPSKEVIGGVSFSDPIIVHAGKSELKDEDRVYLAYEGDKEVYLLAQEGMGGDSRWVRRVSDSSPEFEREDPRLAVDFSGYVYVFWIECGDRICGNQNIFVQRFDPDGNRLWGSGKKLFSGSVSDYHVIVKSGLLDGNDIYFARSTSGGISGISGQGIEVIRYRMNDFSIQWRTTIDTGGYTGYTWFDLEFGRGGLYFAYSKAGNDIYIQRLDLSTGEKEWRDPTAQPWEEGGFKANISNISAARRKPTISFNGNRSELFVTWIDSQRGANDIYAQLFDWTGKRLWLADVEVSRDGVDPKIESMGFNGTADVVWSTQVGIYLQQLGPNGSKVYPQPITLSDPTASGVYGINFALETDPGYVVWVDGRTGSNEIYEKTFVSQGGKQRWYLDRKVSAVDQLSLPPSAFPSPSPSGTPVPSSSPTVVSSPVATPSPLPSPTLSLPNQVLPQAVIFLRGDANTDGAVDISDAIVISEYINSAKPIVCKDAADFNDDGVITMADVALLQSWLFLGGDPPKAPYPSRGADFTSDKLNCLQYNK